MYICRSVFVKLTPKTNKKIHVFKNIQEGNRSWIPQK